MLATNRWGVTFKKGDKVTYRSGSGMTFDGVYVKLAKSSNFSREYGRQAIICLGDVIDGEGMEVGLDDLRKR